jgi:membrane-associated protease RseP (regulator of RpoE activity)
MKGPEGEEADSEPRSFRPPSAFEFDAIKALVARFFKVYEADADIRGIAGAEIAAFYVQSEPGQFSKKFEELRDAVRVHDPSLMVILQYSGGEDVILIAKKPPIIQRSSGLNLFLFIATILTTSLAGAFFYSGYVDSRGLVELFGTDASYLHWSNLAMGFFTFSLPVMLILGIHELGHYFIAKRHHVRTSLPFFIPVPLIVPIGTLGAFISIREPIPDRKALFDIGAAGPVAGFLATIPILVIGLFLTNALSVAVPPMDEVHAELLGPDGHTWGWGFDPAGASFTNGTVKVDKKDQYFEEVRVNATTPGSLAGNWTYTVRPHHLRVDTKADVRVWYLADANHTPVAPFTNVEGNFTARWDDQVLQEESSRIVLAVNVPANATALVARFEWPAPAPSTTSLGQSILFWAAGFVFPSSDDILIHPTGFAGWVGLLVTGFNLLPAGQLDGGHVARAVLGNHMKWASYAAVGAMFVLSYFFAGWLVMAILIIVMGVRHPPPLNDKTVLDPRRRFYAVLVLALLVICFIPIPFGQ